MITRRAVKAPPDQGGWNLFITWAGSASVGNPIAWVGAQTNGEKGWFGWPTDEANEKLRDKWASAANIVMPPQGRYLGIDEDPVTDSTGRKGMKVANVYPGTPAQRAGLQPSAISQFENGLREPSPENLCKLADALGVTVDYLLGRDQPQPAGPQIQAVLRHAKEMSQQELDELERFAEFLAEKDKQRKRGSGVERPS